jgi:hypothetical protein
VITEIEVYKGKQLLVGHNKSFIKVIANPFIKSALGTTVDVKIGKTCKWHLEGDIAGVQPIKTSRCKCSSIGIMMILIGVVVLLISYFKKI